MSDSDARRAGPGLNSRSANFGSGAATVVSRHPGLSYLHRILTPELTSFLNSTPTLTLFLPVDDAWAALPPLERLWLESEFAADDIARIVNMHTVLLEGEVKWSKSLREAVNRALSHLHIYPFD